MPAAFPACHPLSLSGKFCTTMYWSTVKCQLRFEKAPRHSARECCIAVALAEWLAVLWMVRKVGRIRLAARLWRDLAGTIRILMLAS